MTGKPWQKKRKGGRRGGTFYGNVKGGPPITLQTTDPKLALERLRLLRAGKWAPVRKPRADAAEMAEQEAAAAAVLDAVQGGELPPRGALEEAPPPPLEQPAAPPPAPPPPPPPASAEGPVSPDAVLPPPSTTWQQDAAAAAGDAASAGAGAGDQAAGEAGPQYIDPEQILDLVAKGVVEVARLVGQGIARRKGKVPNDLNSGEAQKFVGMIENATAACTKQALVQWAPLLATDISPGWGMLGGFVLIAGLQFVGAKPDPNADGGTNGEG